MAAVGHVRECSATPTRKKGKQWWQDASGDYCEADLGPLGGSNAQELEGYPWFWGWMSREDCERKLQTEGEVGNFVVRINAIGDYVMSFWHTDGIVHHKIIHVGNLHCFERSTMPAEGASLAGLLDVYMSQYSDKIVPFGGSLFMLHAQDDHWKHQIHLQPASKATHLVPTPPTRRNQYPPVDLKQDLLSGGNADHQDGSTTLETQQPVVPQTQLTDRPLTRKHKKENSRTMRDRRCFLLGGLVLLSIKVVAYFSAVSTTIPLPVLHGVGQFPPNRYSSPFEGWRDKKLSEKLSFGHVITLDYTGQQIAGIRALFSQQCWVASFNLPMKIVEPYTNESCLVHSHEYWEAFDQGKSTMRFSDYFNKDHFNVHSIMTRNPPLVTWEEFLENASHKVVAVTIDDIHHKGCLVYDKNTCQTLMGHNETIWDIFTSGCRHFPMMSNALEFLERKGFKVVRNVCLNCHTEMSQDHHFLPEHITDHIFGEYNPSEITLLIHQWRFSMHIIPKCQPLFVCMDIKTLLLNRLHPNPKILRDADEYMVSALEPDKLTIAVMVRIEWYLIMHKKSVGLSTTIRECLQSVTTLFNDLKQRGSDIQPFLTLDVGKYGSSTLHSTLSNFENSTQSSILSTVKSFVSELYDSHLTIDEWEKTFTLVSDDRGYVAALQRTIAARASCLILMGGGHFQEVAFQDYLRNHPSPSEQCIHHVCMPNNFEQSSQKNQQIFNSQLQNNYNIQQL